MKKLLIAAIMAIALFLFVVSCGNRQLIDTAYTFDTAIILLPNGEVVEGDVESWSDYSDGGQIQVKIDGTTYLAHSSNVVLIQRKGS